MRPESPSTERDPLVGPGVAVGAPVGAATLPPVALDAGDLPVQPLPTWRLAASTFGENRLAVVSLIGLILIVLFCYVGPLIYHTNQVAANLLLASQHPSAAHILGTTPEGRDELGALMLGGQSSIEVGLAVAVIATAIGLVYGLISGYIGGILDAILMRIVDAVLAIPFFFFVVLLASLVTPTLWLIILVITSGSWLSTARLVRAEALSLRTRDYVKAAEAFGSRSQRILFRHITPNLLGVVIVNATLQVADAILAFATISYLGLGVPPPHIDWGLLLTDGINNLFNGYWWQLWPPAFLIVVTVLAVSVLGDGLRDVAEGRLQRR